METMRQVDFGGFLVYMALARRMVNNAFHAFSTAKAKNIPSIVLKGSHLFIPETCSHMIINHANALHEGITYGGTYKLGTSPVKLLDH